jgi:hypothetical protein
MIVGPRGAVPFFLREGSTVTTPTFENPDELNPFALFAGAPSTTFLLAEGEGDDEDEEWDDDEDDDLDDDDDEEEEDEDDE